MSQTMHSGWLDRPVDESRDHVLGPADARITLVEYGSYACPYCRAANESIAAVRDRFGESMRYVFRQRPLANNDLARRAAELAERTDAGQFWKAHIALMTRSEALTEEDLVAVAADLRLDRQDPQDAEKARRAKGRVEADEASARASGAMVTPTFFINSRRYDGPWDESSLSDAMLGTLEQRVRSAALDFVSWGPSAGVLLLITTLLALAFTNSPFGPAFEAFWQQDFGFTFGDAGFHMSLRHWINDGLMSMFFFVVGLELKRELMAGDLSNPRKALLPIAAAIGGMIFPAVLYLTVNHGSPAAHGWGIPMATDIAFALGVIYLLGDRIPLSLKVFLTALAIIDDLGAVLVIAFFYTSDISMISLFTGIGIMFVLLMANKLGVRSALFYGIFGIGGLWTAFLMSGIHATIAAVLAAFTIPADVKMSEVVFIGRMEKLLDKFRKATPNEVSLVTSEQLHIVEDIVVATKDALTPLQRLEHAMHPIVAFVVMPVFALANAGATFQGSFFENMSSPVSLGILLGLYIGKSAGIFGMVFLAVKTGITMQDYHFLEGSDLQCRFLLLRWRLMTPFRLNMQKSVSLLHLFWPELQDIYCFDFQRNKKHSPKKLFSYPVPALSTQWSFMPSPIN